MDWQQIVSLALVALAGALLLRRRFRRRKGGFDLRRDTHCGCPGATGAPMRGSITLRARKGERPKVTVKMG